MAIFLYAKRSDWAKRKPECLIDRNFYVGGNYHWFGYPLVACMESRAVCHVIR